MIHHILHGEQLLRKARSNRRFWAVYSAVIAALAITYTLLGLQAWLLGGLVLLGAYMVHVSHRNVQDRERFLAGMRSIYASQERGQR